MRTIPLFKTYLFPLHKLFLKPSKNLRHPTILTSKIDIYIFISTQICFMIFLSYSFFTFLKITFYKFPFYVFVNIIFHFNIFVIMILPISIFPIRENCCSSFYMYIIFVFSKFIISLYMYSKFIMILLVVPL